MKALPVAVNIDEILEILTEELTENSSITDEGIGHYEFWGATGNDSNICLSNESDEILIDVTNYTFDDVPPTVENLTEDGADKFIINVSKSNGGDPDRCAESGRTRCGSCNGCDEHSADFTVILSELKDVEGKKIAVYKIS